MSKNPTALAVMTEAEILAFLPSPSLERLQGLLPDLEIIDPLADDFGDWSSDVCSSDRN